MKFWTRLDIIVVGIGRGNLPSRMFAQSRFVSLYRALYRKSKHFDEAVSDESIVGWSGRTVSSSDCTK